MVLNGIMGLTRHRGGGSVPARSDVSWEHYRLIADNSSDVVYECRPTGEILWVQPTVEHLLGFSPDELIGAQARSLIHPDETEMVDRLRASVYSGAELDEIPCRFRTKAGDYRMCSVPARPRGRGGAAPWVRRVGRPGLHWRRRGRCFTAAEAALTAATPVVE